VLYRGHSWMTKPCGVLCWVRNFVNYVKSILHLSSPVENLRPQLPPSGFSSGPLTMIIRSSWDFIPSHRPSFKKIARNVKKMRVERLSIYPPGDSPKPIPLLDQWGARYPYHAHHSPDIVPQPLPNSGSPSMPLMDDLQEETTFRPGSALGLDISGPGVPDLSATGHTRSSSMPSNTLASSAGIVNPSVFNSSVLAPSYLEPMDGMADMCQDERRYRMLLQHDYHTICVSHTIPCVISSLMSLSDAPTLAAISRRTWRRGLSIET
jgi:abelson tyrosine-protein kinase 1